MWKSKLFWFGQPELVPTTYDNYLLWLFAAFFVVGIVLKIIAWVTKHPVWAKLIRKFSNAFFSSGIFGLVWYALRYENTPFFSDRYWAALSGIVFLGCLFYVFKYWFTRFGKEKADYDRMVLNSKYIPGTKK